MIRVLLEQGFMCPGCRVKFSKLGIIRLASSTCPICCTGLMRDLTSKFVPRRVIKRLLGSKRSFIGIRRF